MQNFIKQLNSITLITSKKVQSCNWRNNDKCSQKYIVYRVNVIPESSSLLCFDSIDGESKIHCDNRIKSFRNQRYKEETELLKHIWFFKDSGI